MIVAALFTVMYTVANPWASFGVFVPVLAETFGWSRGAISLAMSINLVLGGVAGFAIGAIADRHGPRAPLAITVALAGLGFALAGSVQTLWQLYLFIGVLGGIGMSSFYVLASMTVSRWFHEHRGVAIGFVLMGFTVGFMTAGPISAALIERVGWRLAWVVLGAGFCLIGTLVSFAVTFPPGAPPASTERRPGEVGRVLRDRRMWAMGLSWFLLGFVLLMLSVHIVPFAHDEGMRLEVAALAITAYGGGALIGRLIGGFAADRLGVRSIIWVCCVVQVVALIPLLMRPSATTLLFVFGLFGIGFAGSDTAFTRAVPEVFGLRALGAVFGVLSLGWRAGAALGPVTAGYVHDVTGSYMIPFAAAPIAVAASAVLFAVSIRKQGGV